ncbi:hypothetical protein M427DRAFT_51769, partial [Gonapodya prolifera JEL478]
MPVTSLAKHHVLKLFPPSAVHHSRLPRLALAFPTLLESPSPGTSSSPPPALAPAPGPSPLSPSPPPPPPSSLFRRLASIRSTTSTTLCSLASIRDTLLSHSHSLASPQTPRAARAAFAHDTEIHAAIPDAKAGPRD